ncbi:MAG: antibiotic biosynthesis monooxygenase [Anaerolineales bacterium]|jgi:quinol monooxygenase YgiN
MHVVLVYAHVKPEAVEAFRAASVENARHSLLEPGVARFDVIQQQEDPTQFLLMEAYRTVEDSARHKGTPHYAKWRDTVAELMAEPRSSLKYSNVFPEDRGWK